MLFPPLAPSDLHFAELFGMASDRYAGWIGQDTLKSMAHGAKGMV
jgi:hypothetical protein